MPTASIPRFSADSTAEEVSAALVAHGVVVIERLADADLCDRIAAELQPAIDATPTGSDPFSGFNTRRTGALLTRAPSTVSLVGHPLVLDVVDRTLWPQKTTFQLHLTQSIALGPDSQAQVLHRDHWCFDFFPFPDDVHVEVSTIWALTDFTEINGATRVVPDSHGSSAEHEFTHDDTLPAEMPRGSVVLYLGSTVHGGGANRSDAVRVGINVDYVLGWLRQEENQYLSVPHDLARKLDDDLLRVLGYARGAYALGYVDDLRDPLEALKGEGQRTEGLGNLESAMEKLGVRRD